VVSTFKSKIQVPENYRFTNPIINVINMTMTIDTDKYRLIQMELSIVSDNGGKRSGIDRRAFEYAVHLPEKRSDKDRRDRFDRRGGVERRSAKRSEGNRRQYFTV
jgi:hypothetical protein